MQQNSKSEHSSSLRFGVLCNGSVFQRWQADALDELSMHGHQLQLLIVDNRISPEPSLLKKLWRKRWGTVFFNFLENRVFRPEAKQSVDFQSKLKGIEVLNCIVEKRGFSEFFSETDIGAIRNHRLDFILRFGFNIIRGEILTVARFGVWSFHHGDEMLYRGGPAGFWEIFKGDPVSGAILQQLTSKLDAGVILKKGYLKTLSHSYRENLNRLLMVSSSWPASVADQFGGMQTGTNDGYKRLPDTASPTVAVVYKVPGNVVMLKFLFLLLRNRLIFYYQDLIAAEFWNVGVVRRPIHELALGAVKLADTDISWLPPMVKSGYIADPFGFMKDGRLHVLVEDYSYISQKASITEITLDPHPVRVHHPDGVLHPDGVHHPDRVDGVPPHLSYPFVFEHNNQVFCLPEAYQTAEITLYRRDQASEKFVKDRVLLANVFAIDPTMVFYNGFWWLFFTTKKYSNTHLFIYYSEDISGEFKPHRLNPVKTDIRSSRPAGTPFIHHNILYRPAQDCSVTYGGRVAINRVLNISPDDFYEEVVNVVEPLKGSEYNQGLHTISGVGNFTLVDGKKYRPSRIFFIHQILKKIRRKDGTHV